MVREWAWVPAIPWIVLASLGLLHAKSQHLVELIIYGIKLRPAPSDPMLLKAVVFCLLVSPLALLLRGQARKVVIALASAAIAYYLAGWKPLACMAAIAALLFPLPFLPLSRRLKLVVLVVVFGLMLWLLGNQQLAGPNISWYCFYFCVIAGFKYLLFFYEMFARKNDWSKTIFDYFLYLLAGPFFVVLPYQVVIPAFSTFRKAIQKKKPQQFLTRAAGLLFWAAVNLGLLILLNKYGYRHLRGIPVVKVVFNFTLVLLGVSAASHFLVALLCLWGFDMPDPFQFIVLSRGLAEFLNRFAPHFKDCLATLFYYPMLMTLRRLNRTASFVISLAFTLIVGNSLIHLLRYAFFVHAGNGPAHRMMQILKGNAMLTGLLILWLLLEWGAQLATTRVALLRSKPVSFAGRIVALAGVYVIFSYVWFV